MTKTYIGTKIVRAWESEKDGEPGYSVMYADGYTSWSPKATFEACYRLVSDEEAVLVDQPVTDEEVAECAS